MSTRQKSRISIRKGKGDHHAIASPRFSVILCTYNRRNMVLSTLASLRRQTLSYNQFEVIVVDNGSSDGTVNAVRAYVSAGTRENKRPEDTWRVQCLTEPRNGLAHARNTGLQVASGEIAVFIDDDTLVDLHYLERLLVAYEETGADAIGGRVELRWEAPRPHWLTDDLLETLGYFAPSNIRMQLSSEHAPVGAGEEIGGEGTFAVAQSLHLSSCNFSVKLEVLRAIGYFSSFLSKRLHLPANAGIQDVCLRLHAGGYTLWYEPAAVVVHRVPASHLTRPFFVGRAYWQGVSEVLAEYVDQKHHGNTIHNTANMLQAALHELREIAYLGLIHRPLLRLAGRSTNERLLATMGQARNWGRLRQRLRFLEHAPAEMAAPAVLLVHPPNLSPAAELLAHSLQLQNISCTLSNRDIPLSWLWQHRAYSRRAIGILHLYRPGAFDMTPAQRQRLWFRLWLAQRWGVRIITTDAGGWWQSTHNLRYLSHRMLERRLLRRSDTILAFTRQPDQLYPDKKLRRHVRCLPHPGFRGYYPGPLARNLAFRQLGLPTKADFVYLCLISLHTEQEIVYLIEAFREITIGKLKDESAAVAPQLLLAGTPGDKKMPMRIVKLAAVNPAIHLSMATLSKEDIPTYMGATDSIVLPHFAVQTAGMLETAVLGLSFERTVVVPDLPRFRGMLPPRASVLYEPGSRESLGYALIKAQKLTYSLNEKEAIALEATSSWEQYAQRLVKIYTEILNNDKQA